DARMAPNFCSIKSGLEIADPDAVPLRIPAAGLKPDDWNRLRIGWEAASGTVWLGLNNTLQSAKINFRKAYWLCLLVGTPPKIGYTNQRGFDGDIDNLVVDSRSPGQAPDACALPSALPSMATPEAHVEPAVHLKGSPMGEKMESLVRTHYNMVLRTQRPNGGWAFSVAWPSYMCFLSTKVVIPYARGFFNGSKDGNSAGAACKLIAAWHVLGDKKYLDGAERCAQTLLRTQRPQGFWPYAVRHNPDTGEFEAIYDDEKAPIEDHVQSHPICLFYALHAITGKPEYKAAADKAVEFIYKAQNYTGSWSHHYNLKNQCGEAAQAQYKRAGEINDDSTADQMTIMLMAWRRTGEIRFLASYLRAADWLKSAFIDDKGKGWAQQYDEHNVPIEARHFEPAAISLSEGIDSAPKQLIRAWRLTGDAAYLEPVKKWHRWMMDNRTFTNKEKTKWGWHDYYDPATGQPFRYEKRKRLPADPRQVSEGGYSALLREIERLDKPVKPYVPSKENAEALLKASEGAGELTNDPVANRLRPLPLVESFDWTAGSWVFTQDAPHGPSVSPQTIRGALILHSVFLRRQLRGQIPFDHPLAALGRAEWGSPFYMAMPPRELLKPISPEDVAKARAWIAANPPKPTGPKSAPSPKPGE
ncbi:MAG TPA: hypothetical protein P5137_09515, partial [Candidatus Brocadiia bacterium]|nr:hypothetical protein [Candidatus Brocadiia bacterium]